jgi:hypothetical protein
VSNDISPLINGWDYDLNSVNARWITADDGTAKIQMRVDMGILQMEPEGRPDGARPQGQDSLRSVYLQKELQLASQGKELVLDAEACAELQQEAMQFYYRYLALYALRHLDGVIADTQHNLDLFDLVSRCADDDNVVWHFLQYFPYVRMMNARARCEALLEHDDFDRAIAVAEDAMRAIEAFFAENADDAEAEQSSELEILEDLLYRIRRQRPKTEEETLHELLDRAIHKENYERAAELRDALRALDMAGTPAPRPSEPNPAG